MIGLTYFLNFYLFIYSFIFDYRRAHRSDATRRRLRFIGKWNKPSVFHPISVSRIFYARPSLSALKSQYTQYFYIYL